MNYNSVNIALVLLGDPAYPQQLWFMTPFIKNGHLTDGQRKFNYRLSHASVVVEHTYGRLKGRWCCLLKRLDVDISCVPEFILLLLVVFYIIFVRFMGILLTRRCGNEQQ